MLAPSYSNIYRGLVSGDYNISESDQLRVRYIANNTSRIDNRSFLPAFYFARPTNAKLFSLSEFHAFQPNLANEVRLAYNRFNDNLAVSDHAVSRSRHVPQLIVGTGTNLGFQIGTQRERAAARGSEHVSDRG